eukprot:2667570-Pyramimonas_sp.AAC.1
MSPRRLWGLRTANRPTISRAGGPSNIITSYVHHPETSPSLGAASCTTVATFEGCWRPHSDVIRTPE